MIFPLAAIDWHASFFMLFAALACAFAVAVVASSNIVRMAFYLTLCLGSTAGLFFLAGAQFVGSMQFMIYVGGTLVLLIFGVMLTAQAKFISMKTGAGEWVAGGILGAALLLLLVRGATSVPDWQKPREDRNEVTLAETESTTRIGLFLAGIRPDKLEEPNPRLRAGMSGYLLPFVIVSMHLLVVLVGAAYLARTRRGGPPSRMRSAIAPVTPDRKHSFFVKVGVFKGMVVNVLLAVAFLTLPQWVGSITLSEDSPVWLVEFLTAVKNTPGWLPVTLATLCGVNVLLLAVVWQWQKWGVVGLVIVPLVAIAVVASTSLGLVPAIVLGALLLMPVAALVAFLVRGGERSEWSRME